MCVQLCLRYGVLPYQKVSPNSGSALISKSDEEKLK
jgi:hypothetical protein